MDLKNYITVPKIVPEMPEHLKIISFQINVDILEIYVCMFVFL